MTQAYEVNFDGLVGPTHNYGGLSYGNVASKTNARSVSNPKAAAKQGLVKMKHLADLGLKQAVLPPHERPDITTLRRMGFQGKESDVLKKAYQTNPLLFSACCASSNMWVANAATVSPSGDTADGRVHFTSANLASNFHRSLEHPTTKAVLQEIFSDDKYFVHHAPLPFGSGMFDDEGAANHTRFCRNYRDPGIELFVFGKSVLDSTKPRPHKFPARHTYEAVQAIIRLHQLDSEKVVIAQQHPDVIDQGVFHNDVISVGNRNVFLYHTQAFVNQESVLEELQQKFGGGLYLIQADDHQVPVEDAVQSYLFNSQLLTLPDQSIKIVAPLECQQTPSVKAFLDEVISQENPIQGVHYFDLQQSMKNGGGPACLRLRVVLNEEEMKATNPHVFITEKLYIQLEQWVEQHYRDELCLADMTDPSFINEVRTALDELTQLLHLGSVYPFQQV